MITSREYVKRAGQDCPNCGGPHVQGDRSVEVDGGTAWQNCSCTECEATWTDNYKLVGYSDLAIPEVKAA